MDHKLSKLRAITLVIEVLIALAVLWTLYSQYRSIINLKELKSVGYLDLNRYSKIDFNNENYTVFLNDKSVIKDFKINDYNDNPTLCTIQTTLIPNNDKVLYQLNWKLPILQRNNLNYLNFINNEKLDSFYIPAIKDYSEISKGFPIVMLYIDSADFFSDSSGIYIPGINKNPKNIKKGGNYAMRGKEWERPVYIQLFDKAGFLIDQGWMGTRIHGNLSRAAPQKSLRFYPRKKYNKDKVISLINRQASEKRFILRTSLSSQGLIYKDAMLSEIAIDLEMDAMPSTPVITYLNGEYWGYANYRERIDEYFFFENYDIDTLDFIDLNNDPKYGSADDYIKMDRWITNNDLRIDTNYNLLLTNIDIDNYMRYLLLELFFANKDWPHNNVRVWKSSEMDNKWRWLIFDMDACGKDSVDMAEHLIYRSKMNINFWGKNMLFGLLANEEFYDQLLLKYSELKEEQLNVDYLLAKSDSMKALYMPLLPDQIKRWGYPLSIKEFEEDHENFKSFLRYREDVILNELERIHEASIEYQEALF